MKKITSRDNRIYKEAVKLTRRKYRDLQGKFLLEGIKPVEDAIEMGMAAGTGNIDETSMAARTGNAAETCTPAGTGNIDETGMAARTGNTAETCTPAETGSTAETSMAIETIFVRESSQYADQVRKIMDCDRAVVLSDDLFDTLTDTCNSQGVVGIVRKQKFGSDKLRELYAKPNDLYGVPSNPHTKPNIIIADRLQDPGNMGTIIRTAEAAGFAAVIVMPGTVDPYSPKVVRAASGSLLRVSIIYMDTEESVAAAVHQAGLRLAVTALEGGKNCFTEDISDCALVIGNEGAGVSTEFMELADIKVYIPMEGKIESLNAAVAAGVLMYTCKANRSGKENDAGSIK